MARSRKRVLVVGKIYREGDLPALVRHAREQADKTVGDVAAELALPKEAVIAAETRAGTEQLDVQRRIVQHYTPYRIVSETRFRLQRKAE